MSFLSIVVVFLLLFSGVRANFEREISPNSQKQQQNNNRHL